MDMTPIILRITDIQVEPTGVRVTAWAADRIQNFAWPIELLDTPCCGDVYVADTAEPPYHGLKKVGQSYAKGSSDALDSDVMRWRKPQQDGVSRMKILHDRAVVRRAVRDHMDGAGFLEVDVPLLVHGVIPDAALHSFTTGDRFLVTTTENQLKRLETGGFDKIYSLTKNFREGDTTSPYRNPEFTMLEWARVGATYDKVEQDAENIVLAAHQALGGTGQIIYQGHKIDLSPPWERLTVKEAVFRHTGYQLRDFSCAQLREALVAAGVPVREAWGDDRVFLCSLLMDHIQQFLGFERPVLLQDWPAFQTSMALEKDDGETAFRSEVYIAGIELADGFPALTDYTRQKETFETQIAQRQAEGLPVPVIDTLYLKALEDGLPQESSIAMGFDRLVMILTNQSKIKSVLAFSWDEL